MDRLGIAQMLSRIGLLRYGNQGSALEQGKAVRLDHPAWQPLPRQVERLFVTRDGFERFVAQNLVVDGLIYTLVYRQIVDALSPRSSHALALLIEPGPGSAGQRPCRARRRYCPSGQRRLRASRRPFMTIARAADSRAPVFISLLANEALRAIVADNPEATVTELPPTVKSDVPGRLVICRESVEAQLGRRSDVQDLRLSLIPVCGNIEKTGEDVTGDQPRADGCGLSPGPLRGHQDPRSGQVRRPLPPEHGCHWKLQGEKDKKLHAILDAFGQNDGLFNISGPLYFQALKIFLTGISPLEYASHRGFCVLGRE